LFGSWSYGPPPDDLIDDSKLPSRIRSCKKDPRWS
jgi:hypothetical protein